MVAENLQGRPSRYPGHGADLLTPCQNPSGTSMATWKWLRALAEHEAHRRFQPGKSESGTPMNTDQS